MKKAFPKFEW